MKKKIVFILVTVLTHISMWGSNVITYRALNKLPETTTSKSQGLHTNAFNVKIVSHEFQNGIGVITFAGDVKKISNYAFYKCDSLLSVYISDSVSTIGDYAFGECTSIDSITLPDQVSTVGKYAFIDCSSLKYVSIGKNVATFGQDAFANCTNIKTVVWNAVNCQPWNFGTQVEVFIFGDSVQVIPQLICSGMNLLTSIIIPNSVIYIGRMAFNGCISLSSITIGNSVTSIGDWAFSYCCSITSITIPNSVTRIGEGAFSGCKGLTEFIVDSNNNSYSTIDGVLLNLNKDTLIQYPIGNARIEYIIPNCVSSIESHAFSGGSFLLSITIPNSVTSIGYSAFEDVNNIVYSGSDTGSPWGAKSVNGYVDGFIIYESQARKTIRGCSSAASGNIVVPNTVSRIADNAFEYCDKIKSVTIPSSVKSIGKYALAFCSQLNSISIGSGLDSIGLSPLFACLTLSSIKVDKNNSKYDSRGDCNAIIESATNKLIAGCSSTIIPRDIDTIGYGAFDGDTILMSITIPNNVTCLENRVFSQCFSLTSIQLPYNISYVGREAFYNCHNLKRVSSVSKTPPVCAIDAFQGIEIEVAPYQISHIPLFVPEESIELYRAANGWKNFTNILPLSLCPCGDNLSWTYCNGVLTIIGTGPMYDYEEGNCPWSKYVDSISSVIVHNGVTSIGEYALSGFTNKNLKSIILPNSIVSIEQFAFANCQTLKSVTIGAGITNIAANAFYGDKKLYDVICYAQDPPTIATNSFANYSVYLHTPCEALRYYKIATGWSQFGYFECVSAEEEPTTDVKVVPTDNTATITWPTNTNADNYTIAIDKDGITFCTLTFNAQGQLTKIAFAPSRGSSNDIAMAEAVAGGYKFTVTSLNPGTKYTYEVDTKNSVGTSIANYTGQFTTTGATVLDQTSFPPGEDRGEASIIIKNGQLLILRDGKTYNAQGAEVK